MNKTPRNALLLSAAAVLSFAAVSAAVNILLPYLLTGDVRTVIADPERLGQPGQALALIAVIGVFLLILIALGAYWLYRFFGEAYYGWRGAARWALFGALLALIIKLPDWVLPARLWLVKDVIWVLSAFIAFFIARGLIPLKRRNP